MQQPAMRSQLLDAGRIAAGRHAGPAPRPFTCLSSRPVGSQAPRAVLARATSRQTDVSELEVRIAVMNEEMARAARAERFEEAAAIRDRLEQMRLRIRCKEVLRTEGLRKSICYHLGQVVTHRRYQYKGVVFGVHYDCQASENWIQAMGVDRLPKGRHQPFYQVLVDFRDRSGDVITYVAQENIDRFMQPETIQHAKINELFTSFDPRTSRYTPTARLVSMYPDSLEARSEAGEVML